MLSVHVIVASVASICIRVIKFQNILVLDMYSMNTSPTKWNYDRVRKELCICTINHSA
jgi:hypothetical protein